MILGCRKRKKTSGGTEATAPTLLGVTKPFGGIPWRWKCWATLWRMKMMHTSTSVAQYAILISWGNMLNDRILMDFGDSKFETTPTEPTKKVDSNGHVMIVSYGLKEEACAIQQAGSTVSLEPLCIMFPCDIFQLS